jgi:hypothetical protein
MFNYLGAAKTFAQWQALGYDTHSVVVNPNFINTIDFVPAGRLDYGTSLGSDWQLGLSVCAGWIPGVSPSITDQNGKWQVGARIYGVNPVSPCYISSVIEQNNPMILEMTFSLSLANIVPFNYAFNVQVNSVNRTVDSVAIIGEKVQLTLTFPVFYGDIINIAYSPPAVNPLQTPAGDKASSVPLQPVVNNCSEINNESINLFPNPNDGNFTIGLINPLKDEKNKISVTSFSGEQVYDGIILKEEITKQFDLSFLDPGIYILLIISKEILYTKKFIKI